MIIDLISLFFWLLGWCWTLSLISDAFDRHGLTLSWTAGPFFLFLWPVFLVILLWVAAREQMAAKGK